MKAKFTVTTFIIVATNNTIITPANAAALHIAVFPFQCLLIGLQQKNIQSTVT